MNLSYTSLIFLWYQYTSFAWLFIYLTCYFTVVYSDICLLTTEIQIHDVSDSHNFHL